MITEPVETQWHHGMCPSAKEKYCGLLLHCDEWVSVSELYEVTSNTVHVIEMSQLLGK